ncbi:unnamed protein product [Chrysodeixis includens]|uniref:Chitin-binding type-2 domain-containing protein n=1 Tax=Chrysodeixis includens TaxID=689277 RepID=A0A9N8L656_CHRIL|nr:unnamed protein product [Chrysodeixis includens]
MFASLFTVALFLAATSAAPEQDKSPFKSLLGVDPNSLSCDPAGQIFLLLPHFVDCSKFYSCAHGIEVEFQCPGGTIFDFEQQTCNWSWAAQCKLRAPKDDEDEGSGDEADGLIGAFVDPMELQAVDQTASVRPISPILGRYNGIINCNRADAASKLVAYAGDCQRYWRCVAGVPQVSFCTDGLFFNDLTQQCDFEANVKCNVVQEDELKSEFIKYQ